MKYTRTAITLHWIMALLIAIVFVLGTTMTDIPGLTPTKLRYYSWHKWLGVTLFGLLCIRLLWRLRHPVPTYQPPLSQPQQTAAHWVHVLMYLLMFFIPISGYLYSLAAGVPVVYLGIIPLPLLMAPNPELKPILKLIHYGLNMGLLGVVGLHILAAFHHQFIKKDRLINRMIP